MIERYFGDRKVRGKEGRKNVYRGGWAGRVRSSAGGKKATDKGVDRPGGRT